MSFTRTAAALLVGVAGVVSPVAAAERDGWEVVNSPAKIFVLQDMKGPALD
jgi:hypothetical protein